MRNPTEMSIQELIDHLVYAHDLRVQISADYPLDAAREGLTAAHAAHHAGQLPKPVAQAHGHQGELPAPKLESIRLVGGPHSGQRLVSPEEGDEMRFAPSPAGDLRPTWPGMPGAPVVYRRSPTDPHLFVYQAPEGRS